MEIWTVYLLICADKKTYVGCSQDFEARLERHQHGHVEFTKSRLPVTVILTIAFRDRYKAFEFERYLKSGSGREFTRRHFLPYPP